MATQKDSLDFILNPTTFTFSEEEEAPSKAAITLWISEEYQKKYGVLQKMTNREFSKRMQRVVMKAIDKMYSMKELEQTQL